jgi:hypothetical protein
LSESEAFSTGWRDAIVNTLSGMSESDRRELLARVNQTPEQARRASMSAKASELWGITQQCRDGQGYTAGIADAAAARARPAPPAQPEQPPAPQGFTANRAQQNAGSGTSPEPPRTLRPLR